MNPSADCNRVFRVSRGNRTTSTERPAAPPLNSDSKTPSFASAVVEVDDDDDDEEESVIRTASDTPLQLCYAPAVHHTHYYTFVMLYVLIFIIKIYHKKVGYDTSAAYENEKIRRRMFVRSAEMMIRLSALDDSDFDQVWTKAWALTS